MRVYTIIYREPNEEKEGTVEYALESLLNGSLTADDLDFLAKDPISPITVEYSVKDE